MRAAVLRAYASPAEVLVGSSFWGSRTELAEVVALAQRGRLSTRVDGRIVLVP